MSRRKNSRTPGSWHTPADFQQFGERQLSFLLGSALLNIRNVHLHVHRIDAGTHPHSHNQLQLLYYTRGTGTQTIGRTEHTVNPQTVLFIPAKKVHYFVPASGQEAQVFTFLFELHADFGKENELIEDDQESRRLVKLLSDRRLRSFDLGPEAVREAADQLESIRNELLGTGFGHMLAVQAHLLLLLRIFFREGVQAEVDTPPPSRTQALFLQANEYINQHLAESIRLPDVSAHCCISQNYLQKIFKEMLGKPFSRYLQELRMDHAAYLLKTTSFSVKEVAYACGMTDANYFARLFRKVHGYSPSSFRAA